jgi:hypothetical protein
MVTFDELCEMCEMQSHWLSFDLDALQGRYRITNKPYRCLQKAAAEVRRLVAARERRLA